MSVANAEMGTVVVPTVASADEMLDGGKLTNFARRVRTVVKGLMIAQTKGTIEEDDAAKIVRHHAKFGGTRLQEFAGAVDYIQNIPTDTVPLAFRKYGPLEFDTIKKASKIAFANLPRHNTQKTGDSADTTLVELSSLAAGLNLDQWLNAAE